MPVPDLKEDSPSVANYNSEPVSDQHKGRKILSLVFKTIIFGTVIDLFNATIGLVWKYIKHLLLCLHYFWSPDIDRPPFDTFNFKEFCKHSFEGVVVALVFSFFMTKADWFSTTSQEVKEQISNSDLIQMGYEGMAVIAFAITYFLIILLSLVTGRVIRKWLTPGVTRKESDILMITFFNSFFSLTAVTAIIIRATVSFADNDLDAIFGGVAVILIATCFLLTTVWAVRFIILNKVKGWKSILFFLFSVLIYTLIFSIGGMVTTGLLYMV